jgi:hypothetical protein
MLFIRLPGENILDEPGAHIMEKLLSVTFECLSRQLPATLVDFFTNASDYADAL